MLESLGSGSKASAMEHIYFLPESKTLATWQPKPPRGFSGPSRSDPLQRAPLGDDGPNKPNWKDKTTRNEVETLQDLAMRKPF